MFHPHCKVFQTYEINIIREPIRGISHGPRLIFGDRRLHHPFLPNRRDHDRNRDLNDFFAP